MSFLGRWLRRLSRRGIDEPAASLPDLLEGGEPAPPEEERQQPASSAGDDLRLMQFALEEDAAVTLPAARQLLELLDALARPGASPPPAEEILRLCDELEAAGHGRRAQELLERLCALLPDPGLRLQLARLLHRGKDWARAIELLHALTREQGCRLEAHFLLGDYHGQQAEAARALEHYEAVLALDYTFPRAASRVAELRERLDQPLATSAPTILGAEDLGRSNRFLLQRELGRGGSGTVYLALDRGLGRAVAVKALHRQVAQRPDARAHLFCEARITSALQHPGIVAIYDLDEELNLVVMEYCAGGTLAERLSAYGAPALVVALGRLAEVASTLDTVHRCGVVHRDLKPANLLFRRAAASEGIPPLTITDFGIAHAGRAEDEDPTVRAAGSLLYMAPEQRRGREIDPRADLYSLGVIALELILGRPPLTAHEALQGCTPLDAEEPWRALRDRLPRQAGRELLELLRTLLEPTVGARPADAAEVAGRLAALARQALLAEDRRAAYLELEERAGPPQARSAAVERWLGERLAELCD